MITIVNLKTNKTGVVSDHVGMDDKLLASQGYARIDVPEIPQFTPPSMTLDQEPLTAKHLQEFQENVEAELTKQKEWLDAEPIPIVITPEHEAAVAAEVCSQIVKSMLQPVEKAIKKRKKRTHKPKHNGTGSGKTD